MSHTPPVDDIATWGALAERWSLFCETLHHHHTGEDEVLWPLLLERSNPAEQVVIYAMEAEHEVIDPLMALCTAGFLRMATPDPDFGGCERIRTDLASAVERTRVVLGNHLAHEEGEAIAIVQRHMTPGEWTDFEKKMGGRLHFARGTHAGAGHARRTRRRRPRRRPHPGSDGASGHCLAGRAAFSARTPADVLLRSR